MDKLHNIISFLVWAGRSFFVFMLSLDFVFAASCPGLCNPLTGVASIEDVLVKIAQVVAKVAFPILVLAFVYVGFKFVAAQGNQEKIKEAKYMFMWTIIAAALILGAPIIIEMLKTTVDQLTS